MYNQYLLTLTLPYYALKLVLVPLFSGYRWLWLCC